MKKKICTQIILIILLQAILIAANIFFENNYTSKVIAASIIEESTENNNVNNISKIKYATAIKLAQDAVADIKKAGYNVSLEEIDTTKDYQIIIKLQK